MERERNKITSVCVYCASSTQVASAYREAATELGHLLGERNLTVTGVIPRFMVEQDWCHKGLTDLVEVDSMHERKQRMADLSDAVIALPGGCGTLEELLEVITWKQLGLYLNPIVILNINGYFDPLLEMFRRAVDEHFMRPQHAALWTVASTPAEAVGLIFSEPVWDANIRKLALV